MKNDGNSYVKVRKVRDFILPGQVTVLASRPGMGKTALACDLIAVSDSNVGCMSGYFAVYEDAEEVVNRIAARGNVACMVFSSLDAFSLYDTSVLQPPLLVVDYIPYNPDEDFREFFEMVKTYSEGHQTSVLVLSQISRDADSEYRKFGRPIMDDLPMQNCFDLIDNIIFLYREDYYSGDDTGEAEAIFEKCPSGYRTISLWWDEERATFL